jgi:hypothetical protein
MRQLPGAYGVFGDVFVVIVGVLTMVSRDVVAPVQAFVRCFLFFSIFFS